MRILFVLEHYYPYVGGAEKLFRQLAEELVKQGNQVQILTSKYSPSLPKEETINGVNILRIPCHNRFGFTFLSIPHVIRQARQADLIQTTTYNAALPAWIGGKWAKKQLVLTFHEVWGNLWHRLPFISFFQRWAYYLFEQLIVKLPFDRVVGVSRFTVGELIANGIPQKKVALIYNGLTPDDYKNLKWQPSPTFEVSYFGRLGVSKGLDLLLPAAALFFKKHPDARLRLIIPETPKGMFRTIKQIIAAHHLSPFLILRHNLPRETLFKELTQTSAVIIPSYSEGFCFVAAESVAMGIPIISSDQGALKEVVSGQIILMKEMTIDGVLQALLAAYNGHWSFKDQPPFLLSNTVNQYISLYKTMVN